MKTWKSIHEDKTIDYYVDLYPEFQSYVDSLKQELKKNNETLESFLSFTQVTESDIFYSFKEGISPQKLFEDFFFYGEEIRKANHTLTILSPTIYTI